MFIFVILLKTVMRKKTAIIDIESNGLLSDMIDYSSLPYKLNHEARLWVVVIRDHETGEEWFAEKENITAEWLKETLSPFYFIVAHNGIKFDFPALKLFGIFDYKIGYVGYNDYVFGRECKFLDSLILSKLANPDRLNRHSLKSWGQRIGDFKEDYRQKCIEAEYISANSASGEEFRDWNALMLPYCKQDCKTNSGAFTVIAKEFEGHNWGISIQQEHKLADLSVRREHFGFDFDKELAVKCVNELNGFMDDIANKVEPILPPKPLNSSETSFWTPPITQLIKNKGAKKDSNEVQLGSHMENFIERIGATYEKEAEDKHFFLFENQKYRIPYAVPIKTHTKALMKDMDHIKMYLVELGWEPTEWSERDLTKDSKKKSLSLEKREKVLERWFTETKDGKYTKGRLKQLGFTMSNCHNNLYKRLNGDFPVRVPTAPKIRVGVEKEICPNLIKLGEKVDFAKDYANYLTYRHRRNSIAGGDTEDLDLNEEEPVTGFLKQLRDSDGRIPTPADEIGAITCRFTHKGVSNIPRASSMYGKEMRSLFRAGKGGVFFGFDYASLEARIMAHYVFRYKDGIQLGKTFLAEKPNDFHTLQAKVMGIGRTEAKSVDYGIIYGAQFAKIMKMLGVPKDRAVSILEGFWEGAPALKELRDNLVAYWEKTGNSFVLGIDGRKINVRSKHSLLNSLFQSAGVIYAKHVFLSIMQSYEDKGFCTNPFEGKLDIGSMISYHDEEALWVDPKLLSFKKFDTKKEAQDFIDNWSGPQLSPVSDNGKGYYVVMPSVVSEIIEESMRNVTKLLNINVDMGFEYMVGQNWYQCH